MSSWITIPAPAHDYYAGFYVAGFAVAGALLLRAGHRRGYARLPWLLLVTGASLLLIIGTKVAALPAAAWWAGLLGSAAEGRSILGGLVGVALGVAGLRRALGFGRDAYDAFAGPLLLGLAVQGVGCLLTGCCFGTPAGAWPGLSYAPGTLPFVTQAAQGILAAHAQHSLPVHPAQLYQMLLCLALAGALFAWRRPAWLAGTRFWLALGGYAAGRFGLEFVRDAAGDVVGTGFWLGLKPVQWGLVAATLAVAALLRWRRRQAPHPPVAAPSGARCGAVLLALLALGAALGPGRLMPAEAGVLLALLLAALATALSTSRLLHRPRPRLASRLLGLGTVAAVSMGQAPAPATAPPTDEPPRRYTTLRIGGMVGGSEQFFASPYGCSGTRQPVGTYRQRFQVGSVGVARTLPVGQSNSFALGVDVSLGRSRFQPNQDTVYLGGSSYFNPEPFAAGKVRLFALSPYVEFTRPGRLRWLAGVHFGDVAYDYVYEPGKRSPFRLQSLLEVGPFEKFFVHASVNHGLLGLGNGLSTAGLGSGFGSTRHRWVAGVALANSEANGAGWFSRTDQQPFPFVQGTVAVGPRWQVQSFAATNFGTIYQFRVQTQYRLPGRVR